jgi:hypothetical protein
LRAGSFRELVFSKPAAIAFHFLPMAQEWESLARSFPPSHFWSTGDTHVAADRRSLRVILLPAEAMGVLGSLLVYIPVDSLTIVSTADVISRSFCLAESDTLSEGALPIIVIGTVETKERRHGNQPLCRYRCGLFSPGASAPK